MDNSGASCITSIYHKSTYTGLLTNFLSFTCFKYKVGLIYILVDRIFKINNTITGMEKDLQQLLITLQRNSLPSHLIDKIIKGYKNKFYFGPTRNNTFTTGENTAGIRSLPSNGTFFCQGIDIRIVFSSLKIKTFFQFQRSYSRCIKILGCVSIYLCGMNSCYIGDTSRATLQLGQKTISYVYKHLNGSPSCKGKCSVDCFKVIDSAKTRHCLN